MNGWENYPTWATKAHIENTEENTEESYIYWRDITLNSKSLEELEKRLKKEITEAAPDLGPSLYKDILQFALDLINWHEIAVSMWEDMRQ